MAVSGRSVDREHSHLTSESLDDLLTQISTEDHIRHLLHLIAVCPECNKAGSWLLVLDQFGTLPRRFNKGDILQARSLAAAPALWECLEPLPHERRLTVVLAGGNEFLNWGFAVFTARRSLKVAPEGSTLGVELAELAVVIAEKLERDQSARHAWIGQLLALTLSYLGNARRVAGDLRGASKAFEAADNWKGTGVVTNASARLEPEILCLKASLRIDQRHFHEALSLLDQVIEIYLYSPDFRDYHLAGTALLQKANALIEMGDMSRGLMFLEDAKNLIDPEREPRLLFALKHNLMESLTREGHFAEAESLLASVRKLAQAHGGRLDRLRLRWVEARIMAGLGDRKQGRQTLEEVRQEFLSARIIYDYCLATLELAVLNLEEGRTTETKILASEIVNELKRQNVSREALAAVLTLQKAAAMEAATGSLAREVAARLDRIRREGSFF